MDKVIKEYQEISLDFNQNNYKAVTMKQYDKASRYLKIQCTQDGKKVAINQWNRVEIKILTPDNRPALYDVTVNDDGTLFVEIRENILLCPGNAYAEIVIYDNAKESRISTMNFVIIIEGSVYPDDVVIESEDFAVLTELINKAQNLTRIVVSDTKPPELTNGDFWYEIYE